MVQREMDEKLVHRTIKVKCDLSNKCRRIKKPYWNESLTELWNDLITIQRATGRTMGIQKAYLTTEARGKQKAFDRVYQSAKHQYWHKMQNDILSLQGTNPKEYWKYVGKIGMGSVRKIHIPWEVTMEDGTVSQDFQDVMNKWSNHFSTLLNDDPDCPGAEPSGGGIGDDGIEYGEVHGGPDLEVGITLEEVRLSLARAKDGKAIGWDGIPVEVVRNDSAILYMHHLFNICFESGIIPKIWSKSIINPIPKSSTADARLPSQYRGITLASAIYKIYAGILNKRLTTWSEHHQKISDEQNGFRHGRSCADHLSTLTQIIDSRKKLNQSTFIAFIDFSKVYHRISRPLLWRKLKQSGVSPKFLQAIQSLYKDVKCSVKINGHYSEWFKCQLACSKVV